MPNSTVRHQNGQNSDPILNGNNLRRIAFFWPQVLCMVMIFLGLKSLPAQADQPLMAAYLQQSDIADAAQMEGALLLQNASGEAFRAPLLTTDVKIEVSGLTARVVLTQTFLNRSSDWMSGRYQFPLPEQAAVYHMVMRVGERRIVGQVKEKVAAKKIFDAALRAGKRASLVSQQRPNMFTSNVANIAPGESVSVEIHYIEGVLYDHGEFSLRLPTTFTPRYVPPMDTKFGKRDLDGPRDLEDAPDVENPDDRDDFKNAGQVKQNKDDAHKLPIATGVDPATGWRSITVKTADYLAINSPRVMGHQAPRLTLSATIDAGFPLEYVHSLYHPITHEKQGGRYHVGFQRKSELMNRDFVLRWKPALDQKINAALFKETFQADDYHLLMLLPNRDRRVPPKLPREIVFVIDTSGSMSGVSMRQAKAALLAGLERLSPGDRFNIVDFDSAARQLFSTSQPVSATAVSQAVTYIQQLSAEGGTNISDALKHALSAQSDGKTEGAHVRQVVFITDGSVGNEEALFKQIMQDIQNSRLFTVGIGSAPNSHFMREAATMGRGSFTHIGGINAVTEKINTLFQKLAHPVLQNITIDWSGVDDVGDVEVFPEMPPDLYLSEPLVLYVKTPKNAFVDAEKGGIQSTGAIQIKGSMAGMEWSQMLPVKTSKHQAGIAKQWARQKIRHLMSPWHSMSPEDRKQAVTALALQHQLLSRYTSFVAVEERISRPAEARQQSATIPNAMPHGNTMALPNTATPTLVYFFLGLIALSVLILEVFIGRYFRLITLGAVKR